MIIEKATVRDACGDWKEMPVCGSAPNNGQDIIIVRDEKYRCYAARLTPGGYVMIMEPVLLWGKPTRS